MTTSTSSYNDIIEWLETYFKKSSVKTYRSFESSQEFIKDVEEAKSGGIEFSIDPLLPIDFFTLEEKEGIDDKDKKKKQFSSYNLFWICLKDDKKLERKLQFYRFFLSRISKLKGVYITIVLVKPSSQKLIQSMQKVAEENGFGLWCIDLLDKKPKILNPAIDFQKHMKNVFLKPYDSLQDSFEKILTNNVSTDTKAANVTLFFDSFVREAVEAMVGISAKQTGKRYIERKILDSVFKFSSISYADTLKESVTQHLIKKDDDFGFVSDTFGKLWDESQFNLKYSDFLEISEPPLHNIFATGPMKKHYRDHYLHQFQVFLLGANIIDKFKPKFGNSEKIDKQWLITSSFHDMAYPIQEFDNWATKFFKQTLEIEELGLTDMKSFFVEKSLLKSTGHILNSLCGCHLERQLSGNWLEKERPLIEFYHDIITKKKHHCVLGSIILLKQVEKAGLPPETIQDLFIPSVFAISIHHEVTWKKLSENHGFRELLFTKDPLSFLLLFCDAAQEFGRPKMGASHELNLSEENNYILHDMDVEGNSCNITIKAPYLANHQRFKEKTEELEKIQGFLKSPDDIDFQITLLDKSGTSHPYHMLGCGL